MSTDPHRLPRTALPRRYELDLAPDLARASFTGSVTIDLDIVESTDRLVLNAAELEIERCELDGRPADWSLDEATERLDIRAGQVLAAGRVRLLLHFRGTLNDKLRGFYRSTYKDAAGREHVIATTQMQATDCRRAFPCWDEPEFKAVFSLTLRVEPGLLAIANGPEVSRSERNGRDVVTFADTMPMSTYLVAMVVGPLAATEAVDVNGTPVRIVHVPGKESLAPFGLDAAVAGLRFFEDFYGIPYPSDKIDLVALPDFAAGAMENLGCITFRENALLVDPATSTQVEQQRVVDVITHELAHMWFGDLVTMRWWNGIWLNEAFATFMEVDATDHYRPDWDRWTGFALERAGAFEVDALASTRPVEFEVLSPADADAMFDVLTYQKGGALLRMLQQYLGTEAFRDGVREYLRRHSYGSTETGDLWDAIEAATGQPVRRLMDSWIWQPGFPLVSARFQGDAVVLSQTRFGYTDEAADDPARWMVPVHLRFLGAGIDEEIKVLLTGDDLLVKLPAEDATVVVNAGGHGFFRVGYDTALRSRLAADTIARLTTIDRYNLVSDAWAGVIAGRMAAIDFVELARHFSDESGLAVWQAIEVGLRSIDRLVEGPALDAFRSMVSGLVAPALERLGWSAREGESQLDSQLRGLLIQLRALIGRDQPTIDRCRELFALVLDAPDMIDPDLAAAVTVVAAATGDDETYEVFLDRFRRASTPQETLRFLYGLAEFDDEEHLRRTCDLAFGPDVKTQNAPFLIGRSIAARTHGRVAWRALRSRWAEADSRFPGSSIVRMVDTVKYLDRPEDLADVQAFFAEHPIPQGAATLAQILERQRVNAALREREVARLSEGFGA